MPEPLLEVRALDAHYGDFQALFGVSLAVSTGEIVAVIGAHGAGKSTLLNSIAGAIKSRRDAIWFCGEPIGNLPAHAVVARGIALVPEGRGIFGELTVAENLQLGAYPARARKGETEMRAKVLALFPRLNERMSQAVRTMSGGEQQMVAIGRALMSNPMLLMLDEPSLGLSPLLTREVFRALTQIRASGVSVLLVEQNARASLDIADRVYLIESGRGAGTGPAGEMKNNPDVQRAYLGKARPAATEPPPHRKPWRAP